MSCTDPETCDPADGLCKCGNVASCQNKASGDKCKPVSGTLQCVCGNMDKSCAGERNGDVCGADGTCKCGPDGNAACPASETESNYCDATAYDNSSPPKRGVCKCTATLASCSEMTTGSYCDKAANNNEGACKCSASVDACVTGETCDIANNACKCGSGSSCVGSLINPTCLDNKCQCGTASSKTECASNQKCINNQCTSKFI